VSKERKERKKNRKQSETREKRKERKKPGNKKLSLSPFLSLSLSIYLRSLDDLLRPSLKAASVGESPAGAPPPPPPVEERRRSAAETAGGAAAAAEDDDEEEESLLLLPSPSAEGRGEEALARSIEANSAAKRSPLLLVGGAGEGAISSSTLAAALVARPVPARG